MWSPETQGNNPKEGLNKAQETVDKTIEGGGVGKHIDEDRAKWLVEKWNETRIAPNEWDHTQEKLAAVTQNLKSIGMEVQWNAIVFPNGTTLALDNLQSIKVDFPKHGSLIDGTFQVVIKDGQGTRIIEATRGEDPRPLWFYMWGERISGLLEGGLKPNEEVLKQEKESLLSEVSALSNEAKANAENILTELGYEKNGTTYEDESLLWADEAEAKIAKMCSQLIEHQEKNPDGSINLSTFANKLTNLARQGNIDDSDILSQISNINQLAVQFRSPDRRLTQIADTERDIQSSKTN